jgi:hypothetical protein
VISNFFYGYLKYILNHGNKMDDSKMQVATISQIEKLVGQNNWRNISRLTKFAEGNIEAAARSILACEKPHIAIVAGFFIRFAEPPSPETDGLNGTAHLATAFSKAGYDVTVVTDVPCAKAMWATLTAAPMPIKLEVVDVNRDSVIELRTRLANQSNPPTHFIAIERASPSSDGKPHREHGSDMSGETAPLDLLFHDPNWDRPWATIGIGDGGNEIGMGSLPQGIVESDIPNGELIASHTPADFLLVAGVSNWGAYGLLASIALLEPSLQSVLLENFTGEMEKKFLEAAVELGQAVDDSRLDRPGKPQMTIDRLPVEDHMKIIDDIRALVGA